MTDPSILCYNFVINSGFFLMRNSRLEVLVLRSIFRRDGGFSHTGDYGSNLHQFFLLFVSPEKAFSLGQRYL